MDFNAVAKKTKIQPPVIRDSLDMVPIREALVPYESDIADLCAQAYEITIDGPASQAQATALGGSIKQVAKKIEDRRKELLKPSAEFTKRVNGLAKGMTEPLASAERTIKDKLLNYQRQLQIEAAARAREQEEARRKEEERLRKLAEENKVEMPAPIVQAPEPVEQVQTTIRTECGTAFTKKTWTFRVTKPQEVPREYLVVDEKLIRQAVKNGVRKIDGVEIYEAEDINLRA